MDVDQTQPTRTFVKFPTFNFSCEFFKTHGISDRTMLQTFPAKYFRDVLPYVLVFTEYNEKYVCERRSQFKLRFSNNSDIVAVETLFWTLYISIANKRMIVFI